MRHNVEEIKGKARKRQQTTRSLFFSSRRLSYSIINTTNDYFANNYHHVVAIRSHELVAMSMPSVRLVCRCVDGFCFNLAYWTRPYTKIDLDYTDLPFFVADSNNLHIFYCVVVISLFSIFWYTYITNCAAGGSEPSWVACCCRGCKSES